MKHNRPYQDEPQYLRVLQRNAGGLSQDKRKQLQQLLRSQEVDIFIVMEANLDNKQLITTNPQGIRCTHSQNLGK